jgi:hypothetical protein
MKTSDKDLFDRLAVAVAAVHEADLEYKQARFQYCERRIEHLNAGREPEDFGVVLFGLDAASQARREQVTRDNRAIDAQVERSISIFKART